MPISLEITLIVVLAALAVVLIPLLYQLRRTAQGLDAFLLSSRKDLTQIAEDVHASRLRMDHLMGSLQVSLDDISVYARLMGEAGRALKEFHARFHIAVESASRNLGGIVGGISTALAFFKHDKHSSNPEQEQQP